MLRTVTMATVVLALCRFIQAHELPTAEPETVGMSSEKLAMVVPAMQQLVDDEKVAGAITIVARKGKIVFFEAVGSQNADDDKPMRRDTIVRIYSMTKPITSVAAMMLADEGKLSLDDPLAKHLPELSRIKVFAGVTGETLQLEDAKRGVTIRDLLRHTSGFTYGVFGDSEVDRRYRQADVLSRRGTLTDLVTKLAGLPLLYQPGTRFQYGVSTDVLGRVVEVASGQDFDEFLRQRILAPLDMNDTAFYVRSDQLDRFAASHGPKPEGGLRVTEAPETSPYRNEPSLLSGGGGLVSTAGDYIRFCQMLLNKGELDGTRLLRTETVEAMAKNQLPDEAYPIDLNGRRAGVGFGFGFSVVVETAGNERSRVGEYGWGGRGQHAFLDLAEGRAGGRRAHAVDALQRSNGTGGKTVGLRRNSGWRRKPAMKRTGIDS